MIDGSSNMNHASDIGMSYQIRPQLQKRSHLGSMAVMTPTRHQWRQDFCQRASNGLLLSSLPKTLISLSDSNWKKYLPSSTQQDLDFFSRGLSVSNWLKYSAEHNWIYLTLWNYFKCSWPFTFYDDWAKRGKKVKEFSSMNRPFRVNTWQAAVPHT